MQIFVKSYYYFCGCDTMYHKFYTFVSQLRNVYHKIIMSKSIKIVYDRRKVASTERKGAVEIEVYHNRKRKWIATGVHIYPHEWRNGTVVKRSDAVILNLQIQEKYQEIVSVVDEKNYDISNSISINIPLCDWMENYVDSRQDVSEQTKKIHRVTIRSMRRSGLFRKFSDLNVKNLKLFDTLIREHLKMQTSIYNYHKVIKAYIKIAIQLGHMNSDPYIHFPVPKGKSSGIKYITEQERIMVEELPLEGGMAMVRDMFIFSCYTGLADADLRKLTKKDIVKEDGRLYIIDKRKKTGDRYKLVILPKALEILERYDYNLNLVSNQKCNQYLKAIQVMAGITTNLTMHVGRHTFATWALKKGVRIEVVSKMLAHTNIETTQIYAKVLQEEVTKGFDLLE